MSTLMNVGKVAIAKLMNGIDSVPYFTDIALGSGSTAEAATQTSLVTEITTNGGARAAATRSYVASNTARWVRTFDFTGSVNLREVAIFNSAGTMLLRHVYPADKPYVNGESVEIIIDAVVS